jgi:uncharacterized metal-binding protein YceD (DUF177 family)
MSAGLAWSVPVRIDEVGEAGRRVHLIAEEATRSAVARVAAVHGIERLAADFDLARSGRDGLRVTGKVSATVRQTCVVTLDPLDSEIDEAVDLVFVPGQTRRAGGDEAPLDVGGPEPPEPLVDGIVDLGAIVTEFLILGIDPYPRKPGAVFEAPVAADIGENPFAALAALKKTQG